MLAGREVVVAEPVGGLRDRDEVRDGGVDLPGVVGPGQEDHDRRDDPDVHGRTLLLTRSGQEATEDPTVSG